MFELCSTFNVWCQMALISLWPYVLAAYLMGSIPFGLLLSKLFGKGDIRKIGSGNIGATNVLRTGNKALALTTLLLDFAKSLVPIIVFLLINRNPIFYEKFPDYIHTVAVIIGLFAILGHCFPVWLKFKGGKGVATTFGVLFAAVPWAGFLAAVTWGIVAGFSRYSSLAALSAVALTPLFTFIYYGTAPAIITILIAVLVIWRHKENIKRLTAGTEPKIGASKKKDTDEPAATAE